MFVTTALRIAQYPPASLDWLRGGFHIRTAGAKSAKTGGSHGQDRDEALEE